MKLTEYININLGKKVDYDGAYGAQCVDLFRTYCRDVLDIPHTGVCATTGGARDLYDDYNKMDLEREYFWRLTLPNKIKYGDVAIWAGTTGHVAIVLKHFRNRKCVLVFEQDGLKQDGAKLNVRSVSNLLGVLRFKGV